jgi:hypothetical protein
MVEGHVPNGVEVQVLFRAHDGCTVSAAFFDVYGCVLLALAAGR